MSAEIGMSDDVNISNAAGTLSSQIACKLWKIMVDSLASLSHQAQYQLPSYVNEMNSQAKTLDIPRLTE